MASDSFESQVFLLVSWQSLAMRLPFGTSQWLLGFRKKFSIMLAAQRAFLALAFQLSDVPMSSGSQGSSLDPLPTASPSGELGHSRRRSRGS